MRVRFVTLTGAVLAALVAVLVSSTATAAPLYQGTAAVPTARHVQEYAISIVPTTTPGVERAVGANFAIAPLSPVRITFTNATTAFHTFTIPGLGVSALIPPAHLGVPSKTTVAFTARTAYGVYTWICVICKSGAHTPQHLMNGHVYAIIDPQTLAA